MKTINLAELPQDLVTYLEAADGEDLLILKAGKPIGIVRQISDEDDLFDNDLENHPIFQERIKKSRNLFREGKGIKIEDVKIN